jgi:thiol-disulfide isomerase/thioredoxin
MAKKEYKDSIHQGDNIVNDPDAIIDAYERGKQSSLKNQKADKKSVKKNKSSNVWPYNTNKSKKSKTGTQRKSNQKSSPSSNSQNQFQSNKSPIGGALIKVMSLFFIGIMIIAFTANPISVGTNEGQRAPNIEGKFYNGSGWTEFDFGSYFNTSWQEDDVSGQWVVIEFMDTDCPYCQQTAEEYGQFANAFSVNNPDWNGPHVNFLASATELSIQGHDSDRAEIEKFRSDYGHNFPYIDDLDQDNMEEWGIPGTPNYFLIQPDGIIAWSSSEHADEKVSDAIVRLVPRESA